MFDNLMTVSLAVATISAGIMAGVYFAFSAFIMRAFNQLGPVKATDAMNAINEVILHSWFMLLFFGSTLVYFVLLVAAIVYRSTRLGLLEYAHDLAFGFSGLLHRRISFVENSTFKLDYCAGGVPPWLFSLAV